MVTPGGPSPFLAAIDPRLLARYDGSAKTWCIDPGGYRVAVGASAADPRLEAGVELAGRAFAR